MFWNAVSEGLATFAHWETWVCIVVLLLATGLPRLLVLRSDDKSERFKVTAMVLAMGLPVIQALVMSFLVLSLSPIIFGLDAQAAWAYPWSSVVETPVPWLKMLVAVLAAWLLAHFIPWLGRQSAFHTCAAGVAALIYAIKLVDAANAVPVMGRVALWPGYLYAIGGLAVGALLLACARWLSARLAAREQAVQGAHAHTQAAPRGAMFFGMEAILGLVPVFIYGAWLGEQM
jgi:hypothetical protein